MPRWARQDGCRVFGDATLPETFQPTGETMLHSGATAGDGQKEPAETGWEAARPQRPSHKLMEIEYLRALAVIGVIIHHAQGNLFPTQGPLIGAMMRHIDLSTGVDLFFAISGFVIARSLYPSLLRVQGWAGFIRVAGAFWIRRMWRLLPSAWLWLAIILVASAFFNRLELFGSVQTNIWATVAGMFDFANFRFADAFFRYQYGASFAWWSLSLEEQFYLVLPPVAFLCRRFLPWLLVPLIIYQFQMQRSLLLMVVRTDAIMMGVALACWEQHPVLIAAGSWMSRLPRPVKMLATCGLLVGLVTHRHDMMPYGIGLIALFSAGLVYVAALDSGFIFGNSRVRGLAAWIGARSYALYLIHIPAFFFAREIWFRVDDAANNLAIGLTAIALLGACAELNWRFIEQPVRRRYLTPREG
jgi:peptidoglycan/LPS O-acetylase OafA/YrhL